MLASEVCSCLVLFMLGSKLDKIELSADSWGIDSIQRPSSNRRVRGWAEGDGRVSGSLKYQYAPSNGIEHGLMNSDVPLMRVGV